MNIGTSFSNEKVKSPVTEQECNTLVIIANIKSREYSGIYKMSLYDKNDNFNASMKAICKKDSYIRTGEYEGFYELIFKFSLSLNISGTETIVLEKL